MLSTYEMMLETSVTTGNSRGFKLALEILKDIFDSSKIDYVIAGATALGLYAKSPRNTADIDVFIKKSDKAKFLTKLTNLKIKFKIEDTYQLRIPNIGSGVEVDVLLVFIDPELSAIYSSTKEKLFGIELSIISPEHLLWVYVSSTLEKHKLDAINLIQGGKVSTFKTFGIMKDSDAPKEDIEELYRLVEKSREKLETYSENLLKRLNGVLDAK